MVVSPKDCDIYKDKMFLKEVESLEKSIDCILSSGWNKDHKDIFLPYACSKRVIEKLLGIYYNAGWNVEYNIYYNKLTFVPKR